MSTANDLVRATPVRTDPMLVAVDGVDGSGKTTFAEDLRCAYFEVGRECVVVHLDVFLNPRSIRYRLGRESPEGFFRDTYDLEAFRIKVLEPLRSRSQQLSFSPRSFDCHTDKPVDDQPVIVATNTIVVVEGMFLHRPELRNHWDMSIFLDTPFEVSVQRLASRDGTQPDPQHCSNARYVQRQRIYLRECQPELHATFVIKNF